MEKQNLENTLSECITSLLESINKENGEKYNKDYAAYFKNINLEKMSEWEMFLYELNIPIEQFIRMYFASKYSITGKNLDILVFMYQRHTFVSSNVEKLVDLSRGCCADKTSFIINAYIQYLIGKDVEVFNTRKSDKHQYWEPDFGSKEQWFEFMEALFYLEHGIPEVYLLACNKLLSEKNQTVKEIKEEENLCKDYVPTYLEIINKNKDTFSNEQYDFLTKKYRLISIINYFVDNIRDKTVTEEIVVEKAKFVYHKYCD